MCFGEALADTTHLLSPTAREAGKPTISEAEFQAALSI